MDLERIQQFATRIILKDQYINYTHALKITGLPTLKTRRNNLCLNFAKNCVKNNMTSDMFPKNDIIFNTRQHEEYSVPHAKTERLARSAIPYMARLLNANFK